MTPIYPPTFGRIPRPTPLPWGKPVRTALIRKPNRKDRK